MTPTIADPIERSKLALLKLLTVFTPEQLMQLADVAVETRAGGLKHKCNQEFSVQINDKGYITYFRYVQSIHATPAVKPVNTYRAE